MKKILEIVLLSVFAFSAKAQVPAFPGAEGYGAYASGGRGGKVIYVTRLDDDNNAGSLRYAINQSGSRIVMFKISGTVKLKSELKVNNPNLTIAGQTAPGDGICIRDYPVIINADNVIIRFLRFRMGDEGDQEADALGGRYHKNIIIDHCSMSWSTDECVSFYDNENFTLQWCLISESLRNSIHEKGKHGYGGIWGGKNVSFHHNLLADNDSRNPRFCGSRYSNQPEKEFVDFRNNVIYNWGGNSSYGGEGGNYNIVNNYYKSGPATSSSSRYRILQPYADDGSNNQPTGTYAHFYISGNYVTASQTVSNDNWQGVSLHSSFYSYAPGIIKENLKSESEFSFALVTTHSAAQAYEKVSAFVGASLVRDTIDKRIIHDTENGSATIVDGGNGSVNGLIDTQSAVGGWPELQSIEAPLDTDNDGMSDAWEDSKGLNKNSDTDALLTTVDGEYPNIEVYINSLVADIIEEQNKGGVLTTVVEVKKDKFDITLFYNQSTNELYLVHERLIKKVQVYSISGSIIKFVNTNSRQLKIGMGEIPVGIYLVRIQDEEEKIFSGKVIKQ